VKEDPLGNGTTATGNMQAETSHMVLIISIPHTTTKEQKRYSTLNCCIYTIYIFMGCASFLGGSLRKRIRSFYSIPSGDYRDSLLYCLCYPCALTQEKIEIEGRK